MFQRRHFQVIADAMKQGTTFAVYKDNRAARTQHALMVTTMAIALDNTNPNFDRVRFMRACGLDDETIEAL